MPISEQNLIINLHDFFNFQLIIKMQTLTHNILSKTCNFSIKYILLLHWTLSHLYDETDVFDIC